MNFFRRKKVDFYRSTLTTRGSGFKPTRHQSTVPLKSIVNSKEDVSTFDSPHVDTLLWGSRASVESKTRGHYSLRVGLSRFLARYALDSDFRNSFIANPENFALVNAHYMVEQHDLYIFTEGTSKRMLPYIGNEQQVYDGHLVAQKVDPSAEQVYVVPLGVLIQELRFLEENHMDTRAPLVGVMIDYSGYRSNKPQISTKEPRVIDSLNRVMPLCLESIREKQFNITKDQLIDLVARRIAGLYELFVFNPELITLEQYKRELAEKEFKVPNIVPEVVENDSEMKVK